MLQRTTHLFRLFTQISLRPPLKAGVVSVALGLSACTQLVQPKVEPFYSQTIPPPRQELKWSNGKMPKSLDPARAAAAPETDIVRVIYDGLTELDSRTLSEVPAIAEKWESSADLRTWTFYLRRDAVWTNGERITAADFVRSWKRLKDLGDKTANRYLAANIVGFGTDTEEAPISPGGPSDFLHSNEAAPTKSPGTSGDLAPRSQLSPQNTREEKNAAQPEAGGKAKPQPSPPFGVQAIDDARLKVSLTVPDADFPKLVANPIFRPVYGDGSSFENDPLSPNAPTSGAYKVTSITDEGVSAERSENYWNRKAVSLERVKFVPAPSAEAALEKYRKGEVDVVTNASFEPLAVKLLAPYEDFRRTTFSALNFYEVNTLKPPFNDRRVREALAISIDRDRLAEGELEGTTEAAFMFFPLGPNSDEALALDVDRAKLLLDRAGFPDGVGFPKINLVINRNDVQQRVARSVARMWKQNLGIETNITVKETAEIEEIRNAGDFDLIRRGVVLPAADEFISLTAIFGINKLIHEAPSHPTTPEGSTETGKSGTPEINQESPVPNSRDDGSPKPKPPETAFRIQTDDDAVYALEAIPLYFPVSYLLIKPYVRGFDVNALDAPSLKTVTIDNSWQPRASGGES